MLSDDKTHTIILILLILIISIICFTTILVYCSDKCSRCDICLKRKSSYISV